MVEGVMSDAMHNRLKSIILVVIQFACVIAIAFTGPLLARQPLLLAVELLGIGLGLWAILSMRLLNFNITPDVKIDGYLVARGPYAYIRHPMYASLIVTCGALVADEFTLLRLALLSVLIIDLVVKLRYEEGLLSGHYSEYAAYMVHSKRLIPFVW